MCNDALQLMAANYPDSSFQPLVRILAQARFAFGALLVLTVVLLTWHHFGMERELELTSGQFPIQVDDDRSNNGGASVGWIERRGSDVVFHCKLVRKFSWPFCSLNIFLGQGRKGLNLSEFDLMSLDISHQGPGEPKFRIDLINDEDGLTHPDDWKSYKLDEVEVLQPAHQDEIYVPMRWFSVPQWWKDTVRPSLDHSYVRTDNVIWAKLQTPINIGEGEYAFVVHSISLHGKMISLNKLLMILVALWIICAITWPTVTALALRDQLRASKAELALLAEVNSALELEARELAGQVHIDPLTGVLNRQGLRAALMSTSTLLAEPMSVVFIDIDRFKAINDTHGHDVGDDVLRKFAKAIAAGIRASDKLVRWGGEEFLIVCPMTDVQQAAALAEKLRTAIQQQVWPLSLPVTASFGVAQHKAGEEIGVAIKRADKELYNAKAKGRNRVQAYV
jgi:diguanylate cyclase (GGDEF)-like protein